MSEPPVNSAELASKLRSLGISKPYASQLANRRRKPSLPLAERIENELGVPVSHWFTRNSEAA